MTTLREQSILNFWRLERNSGADPLTANENLSDYAKRLDQVMSEYEKDLSVIRACMERTI